MFLKIPHLQDQVSGIYFERQNKYPALGPIDGELLISLLTISHLQDQVSGIFALS